MTVYIVISPFKELFLINKRLYCVLIKVHHLVVADSLAFSFDIQLPKIENFTKLLAQLFHTTAFAILPSLGSMASWDSL